MNAPAKLGVLNIIVIVLSVYVLGALLVDTLFRLHPETSLLLDYIDLGICLIFFADFCFRLYVAGNKREFMKWGWIDLVSCIPTIGFLRVGRVFRLIRLFRIIRVFRSIRHLLNHIFRNRAEGTLTSALVIAILLVIFSSIAILQFEDVPGGNIRTAEDAIWWTYVTITTVGYGDKYPVTTEGRLIAVILMTAGVGLFGTFTAYVSSWFVADTKRTGSKQGRAADE